MNLVVKTKKGLKKVIFWTIFLGKIGTLFCIALHASTGGFDSFKFYTSLALILPTFTTHLTLMLKDNWKYPFFSERNQKVINEVEYAVDGFTLFSILVSITYVSLIILLINLPFMVSEFTFDSLVKGIGLIEVTLGGYLTFVINKLFTTNN